MKRGYLLEVVLGVLLTGSTAYAQVGMRGGSAGRGVTGFGNSGFNGHVAPASFHGDSGMRASFPVQRNMGEPRGFGHPGIVGDRGSGDRRMFSPRGGFGDRHVFRGGLFEHGCGHGHGLVVFAYGVPYFYYPDYGYCDSAPYYAPCYAPDPSTEYTPDPGTQTAQYANQDADSYYQPGYQWGGELKLYHVTMEIGRASCRERV